MTAALTRILTDPLNALLAGQSSSMRQLQAVVTAQDAIAGTIDVTMPALDGDGNQILAPLYGIRCFGALPAVGSTTTLLDSGQGRLVSLGVAGTGIEGGGGTGTVAPPVVGAASTFLHIIDTKIADYTASTGEYVPCDTTNGTFTVTLPTAPPYDMRIGVELVAGTLPVVVACAGADVLFDATTLISIDEPGKSLIFQFGPAPAAVVVPPPPDGGPPPGAIEVPSNILDATGVTDIATALEGWIAGSTGGNPNVPNGADATHLTHVVLPKLAPSGARAKYRNDGGPNAGVRISNKTNVFFDFGATPGSNGLDGAQMIQTQKKPFRAQPVDPAHANPGDPWCVRYIQNVNQASSWTVVQTWTVTDANGTPQAQAQRFADGRNRTRNFFTMQKCTNVKIGGFQWTGINDNAALFAQPAANWPTGFDASVEAQDGVSFEGCTGCAIGPDFTIEKIWGNAFELVEYQADHTATVGIWVHDGVMRYFGRQVWATGYGAVVIVERCTLAGACRSLFDCEAGTASTPPGHDTPVSEIHFLNNVVGAHGFGMFACHPGVRRVHIAGNTGYQLYSSGVCFAEDIIIEDNVETSGTLSNYAWNFARSLADDPGPANPMHVDFGGRRIIMRNNRNDVHTAAAHLSAVVGGVQQYSIIGNKDRSGAVIAQFVDDSSPADTQGASFTLPVPAHALRDA